jgi:hypothetical protein
VMLCRVTSFEKCLGTFPFSRTRYANLVHLASAMICCFLAALGFLSSLRLSRWISKGTAAFHR